MNQWKEILYVPWFGNIHPQHFFLNSFYLDFYYQSIETNVDCKKINK